MNKFLQTISPPIYRCTKPRSLVCGSCSLDRDLRGRVVAGAAAVSWVDIHLAWAAVAVLTNHSAVFTMRGPMRAHLASV